MCGITGILDLRDMRQPDVALLHSMNNSQIHRGPDEVGIHVERGVGLGHRRLSIIDLSGGQQPLANEDGSVVVVYNGEIYNFRELARELQRAGHQFKTNCDSEVLVHGWEEWGEECLTRLRGMFAFALWDRNQRTLFLARDRLGIKPLYYATTVDGYLIFGSELKSLLQHPGLSRARDIRAIEDYFTFGYVPDPRSIFAGVNKLAPGYYLRVDAMQPEIKPQRYWDVSFERRNEPETDIEHELIARLREAVSIRMIAEVPLGAFLSGGVDSGAVVAMMAEASEDPVNTCSIAFGVREFDESKYADMVANRYATTHYRSQVDPDDFDLLDTLVKVYDEPFADSSAIPTYRVCQLARQRVTVALSGDGGDENFAGYRRYKWHMNEELLRARLPAGIRRFLFGTLGRAYPKLDWAPKFLRAKTTFEAIGRDSEAAYLHSVSFIGDEMRERLFSSEFKRLRAEYRSEQVFREHLAEFPTGDALARIQYLDFKTYLPGDILTKVDRASMAHSLEVRVPLLDHEFVEWVAGLGSDLKLHGGNGKHVFKRALEAHLPRDVIYRPKMGFAVPLARWFRGPLRERVLNSLGGEVLGDCGLFDSRYLSQIAEEHLSGQRDHSAAIWALLMFEGFERAAAQSAPSASTGREAVVVPASA